MLSFCTMVAAAFPVRSWIRYFAKDGYKTVSAFAPVLTIICMLVLAYPRQAGHLLMLFIVYLIEKTCLAFFWVAAGMGEIYGQALFERVSQVSEWAAEQADELTADAAEELMMEVTPVSSLATLLAIATSVMIRMRGLGGDGLAGVVPGAAGPIAGPGGAGPAAV